MADLGIGDLTNGVSVSGAYDYIDGVNTKAIDGAIKVLQDTASVKNALNNGWQGAACENFKTNLDSAVKTIVESLRLVQDGIEGLVAELIDDMANQDSEMVEVEDIINL